MVSQAGGDVDDVAGLVLFHLGNGKLSDIEEAVGVRRKGIKVGPGTSSVPRCNKRVSHWRA